MNGLKASLLLFGASLFLSFTYFQDSYTTSLLEIRATKDKDFKDPHRSPFNKKDRKSFKGLNYFPIDQYYRIKAAFLQIKDSSIIHLPTSKPGTKQAFMLSAKLSFHISGETHQLYAYKSLKLAAIPGLRNKLFVPFFDRTNGQETYGGGRYLDLFEVTADSVELDFNHSYNPLCVFNDRFECPLVPKSNKLSIKIQAGEKMYYIDSYSQLED